MAVFVALEHLVERRYANTFRPFGKVAQQLAVVFGAVKEVALQAVQRRSTWATAQHIPEVDECTASPVRG